MFLPRLNPRLVFNNSNCLEAAQRQLRCRLAVLQHAILPEVERVCALSQKGPPDLRTTSARLTRMSTAVNANLQQKNGDHTAALARFEFQQASVALSGEIRNWFARTKVQPDGNLRALLQDVARISIETQLLVFSALPPRRRPCFGPTPITSTRWSTCQPPAKETSVFATPVEPRW